MQAEARRLSLGARRGSSCTAALDVIVHIDRDDMGPGQCIHSVDRRGRHAFDRPREAGAVKRIDHGCRRADLRGNERMHPFFERDVESYMGMRR